MITAFLGALALAAATVSVPAMAQPHAGHNAAAAQTAEGDGQIKAINARAGTVTLAHGPIASLNWPAMTMPFKVASPAVMNGVKVGQKVHFELKSDKGQPVVTAIHPR